jgi:catechol 2,3-dioxygenase-like lactoylglutathione lyase family enzyme
MTTAAPVLDGIHHLKLPVSDLERSIDWYAVQLGYRVQTRFVEQGSLMGVSMAHPAGGPTLALRLDPEMAARAAGFDYFSFGVPTYADIEALAERLSGLGVEHAGVHFATIGWILPGAHDPDGHEVRFYTTQAHSEAPAEIHDPRGSAERRETEARAVQDART